MSRASFAHFFEKQTKERKTVRSTEWSSKGSVHQQLDYPGKQTTVISSPMLSQTKDASDANVQLSTNGYYKLLLA